MFNLEFNGINVFMSKLPSYSLIFFRKNDDFNVFGREPRYPMTSGKEFFFLCLRDTEDFAEDDEISLFVGDPEPLVLDERFDDDITCRDLFERKDNFRRS